MQSPSEFLEQLATAKHESQIVIAINVDIRGFSRFSLEVESVEASIFIKKFYDQLLRTYFTDPAFFKPTGDGMLMIFPVEEDELKERTNGLIQQSLRLLEDFPRMFDEIPIINFSVPTGVGIGMARGAASRLVAGDTVLDYSGKVLNLASRLMDMAHPAGLILDASIGFRLLAEDLREHFEPDKIYVKSVAEQQPIAVHFTARITQIPASARRPIDEVEWHREVKTRDCRTILANTTLPFLFGLTRETTNPDAIEVGVRFSIGDPDEHLSRWFKPPFNFTTRAGKQSVWLDSQIVATRLEESGVDPETMVHIEIAYPVAPTGERPDAEPASHARSGG
ncbi:hypothetical protein [Conexibacter woesei]|uniref:hypothetical protein n=1 Tax=Conexibacter woesei TaxID=191495 RepID=UPI00040253E4|nr:hypothetical protein [Conexibacter woesei]